MNVLLFPNQLFPLHILKKYDIAKIYFIEDPLYYGIRPGVSLKLNQLRIIFMYVIHKYYVQFLKKHYSVEYYSIDKPIDYTSLQNSYVFDPCDLILERKLAKYNISILDSPSFILTNNEIITYHKDNKRLQHSPFYNYVKNKLDILKDIKNLDIYNREPYKKNISLPANPYRHIFSKVADWEEAVQWISKSKFKNNPKGNLSWQQIIQSYLVYLPLTHDQLNIWVNDFFKERFQYYGKYQDIILDTNPLLYHSGFSIYFNNGMLIPEEIVTLATKNKQKTDLASYEGFIRQIIGWREYARYYYRVIPKAVYRENTFKNQKKITKQFYLGETEIPLVNKTIQYAMNYGYINHIQRLMVISNYMTLWEYHPDMIYKWMFEFSLDSYEWVMIFNCYSMGSWSDHGKAMRKPYISSANYLLKMSNEPKNKEWIEKWNAQFKYFLNKHRDIIEHTQLANLL